MELKKERGGQLGEEADQLGARVELGEHGDPGRANTWTAGGLQVGDTARPGRREEEEPVAGGGGVQQAVVPPRHLLLIADKQRLLVHLSNFSDPGEEGGARLDYFTSNEATVLQTEFTRAEKLFAGHYSPTRPSIINHLDQRHLVQFLQDH